jgi:8-oxo-dGTP diphosphatase
MGQENDVTKRTKVAGGVIIKREDDINKLLVIRRSKTDSWSGTWEFPRGHANEGESLTQALKREVKEESG